MPSRLRRTINGFTQASHFGPTVLVVSISFFLSLSQYPISQSFQISLAILAGQCVVGWTNDLVDLPLDTAASRSKKPLVAGKIVTAQLRPAIFIALLLAILFSLISPLGIKGTLVHALGILSATFYNLKLKKTLLSVLPYVISFGSLPWAIYLSNGKHPPLWLVLGFIFISSAFHFLNVLKDLDADIAQGVLGLPQRVGRAGSLGISLALISAGVASVILR